MRIDAYGEGPRPILDSSVVVTGWVGKGQGIFMSPRLTLSRQGGGLGNISEDGRLMRLVPWRQSAARTLRSAPIGSYTYDFARSRLYIKPAADPNASGKVYGASTLRYGVIVENKTDILVRNLEITRFSLHGINFMNCVRCQAKDSTITDGGGALVSLLPEIYAGNGLEWSGNSTEGVADRLNIRNILDSGISPQVFSADHNRISNIAIRNSSIDSCGFAGVEVSVLPTSAPGASISDVRLSRLTITRSGRGWSGNRYGRTGHGIQLIADPRAGSLAGIGVLATDISDSVGSGIQIEGEVGTVTLDRLRLAGNRYGVGAFANSGESPSLRVLLSGSLIRSNRMAGVLYDAPHSGGFSMLGNSFFYNKARNLHVLGQSGQAAIRNNIFAGNNRMAHVYVENYVDNRKRLIGADVGGNCYTRSSRMFFYDDRTYSTLAAFAAATTFETASVQIRRSRNRRAVEASCRSAQDPAGGTSEP
ncbi:MAG: right-handed parallel beta-helix repeat-containing protein [Panacagrimonas sp.]